MKNKYEYKQSIWVTPYFEALLENGWEIVGQCEIVIPCNYTTAWGNDYRNTPLYLLRRVVSKKPAKFSDKEQKKLSKLHCS